MVFFTCSACGESVKKNQVEKHCLKCRQCKCLSCMDCGKDFWGNDYLNHNQCITEDEKYAGKHYIPKISKGLKKQEQWIDILRATISTSTFKPSLQTALQTLMNHANIPRKQKKFDNFAKSVLKIQDSQLLSEVWQVLSNTFAKAVEKNTPDLHDATVTKENSSTSEEPACQTVKAQIRENLTDISGVNEHETRHKSKKTKSQSHGSTLQDGKESDRQNSTKNGHTLSDHGEKVALNDNSIHDDKELLEGKKSRRQQKKRKNKLEESNLDEQSIHVLQSPNLGKMENNENHSKRAIQKLKADKQCKLKDESVCSEVMEPNDLLMADVDKKRKRKRTEREEQTIDDGCAIGSHQKKQHLNNDNGHTLERFSWGSNIKAILESRENHEMTYKKLSKKMFAAYMSQTHKTCDSRNKFEAKLLKKIKKNALFKLDENRVMLLDLEISEVG